MYKDKTKIKKLKSDNFYFSIVGRAINRIEAKECLWISIYLFIIHTRDKYDFFFISKQYIFSKLN